MIMWYDHCVKIWILLSEHSGVNCYNLTPSFFSCPLNAYTFCFVDCPQSQFLLWFAFKAPRYIVVLCLDEEGICDCAIVSSLLCLFATKKTRTDSEPFFYLNFDSDCTLIFIYFMRAFSMETPMWDTPTLGHYSLSAGCFLDRLFMVVLPTEIGRCGRIMRVLVFVPIGKGRI